MEMGQVTLYSTCLVDHNRIQKARLRSKRRASVNVSESGSQPSGSATRFWRRLRNGADLRFSTKATALWSSRGRFRRRLLCDYLSHGTFFGAAFFAVAGFDLAASAFFAAHRFFRAATMFALPALLSCRLGFAVSCVVGAGGSDSPRILAHRRCCASRIRRRAAAENFLRFLVG